MSWLDALNATLTSWLAPVFSTPTLRWIATLLLCGAYLQGGLTKAFNFGAALAEMKQFGLRPAAPLAIAVIMLEIGASLLVMSGLFCWAGALLLGAFTLFATFLANRFWDAPLPKRYETENSFFEHLGLVGGFLLVAAYDLHG
ncbi:DoxX family protein [Bradyrhizobium sp. CER78]|uniref:DoxX family protein n=1 Tax=Bradyrhizobium sp. CER78 TaxID=3039162 RepID=UPI00244C792E|nr:DoxX family protein [Bradyrhizobium sp. CER78]MDH2384959.1 DoxX family protein [Bradyrhizobium sp. CER78]